MSNARRNRVVVDDLSAARAEGEVDLFFNTKGYAASGCAGASEDSLGGGSTLEIAPKGTH